MSKLSNETVPALEFAAATGMLSTQIVDNSWHTIRGDKSLANGGQEMTLPEALHYEREKVPGVARTWLNGSGRLATNLKR